MNQIISVRSAALTYQARNGEVEALRSVSFDVAEGEFVSIVGPSGRGKSTLLGALAGLETLDGGTVERYTAIRHPAPTGAWALCPSATSCLNGAPSMTT